MGNHQPHKVAAMLVMRAPEAMVRDRRSLWSVFAEKMRSDPKVALRMLPVLPGWMARELFDFYQNRVVIWDGRGPIAFDWKNHPIAAAAAIVALAPLALLARLGMGSGAGRRKVWRGRMPGLE